MPHLKLKSGIDWHYDIKGEGKLLLFIHGWGVDRRIWRQQFKSFAQDYKVMAVDLPGHGKSGWRKVTLETIAEDLRFFFAAMKFEDVTVVGSSLGGLVALKFYEMFPNHIARMIFVGAMPKFAKSEDYPYGLDIPKMRKLSGHLESDYPEIINIFFRSLFTKEERQTRRFKCIQRFRRDIDMPMKKALSEYLDILEDEDLRDVLKRVNIPMQFINGRDDAICTEAAVALIKEMAPQAQFDFFDECGHFPFLSKPYEFNRVMEDFLKGSNGQ